MSQKQDNILTRSKALELNNDIRDEIASLKEAVLQIKTTLDEVLTTLTEQTVLVKSLKEENALLSSKLAETETVQAANETQQEQNGRPLNQDFSTATTAFDFDTLRQPSSSPDGWLYHPPHSFLHGNRAARGGNRGARGGHHRHFLNNNNTSSSTSRQNSNTGKILLIGDSIIKDIKPSKMSKNEVIKKTFPGKNIEHITENIESDLADTLSETNKVIIHVGTNNLQSDSDEDIKCKYNNLISKIKEINSSCRIYVSSLTKRTDNSDYTERINDVNEILQDVCTTQKSTFINNNNIDDTCLNGSKLHLNHKGSAYLAMNFIKAILKRRFHSNTKRSGVNHSAATNNRTNFQGALQTIIQGFAELLLPNK